MKSIFMYVAISCLLVPADLMSDNNLSTEWAKSWSVHDLADTTRFPDEFYSLDNIAHTQSLSSHSKFLPTKLEEENALSNGWTKFMLGIVTEPLGIESSDITFNYVDESPSMDNLSANIDLKSSSRVFGVMGGYEVSNPGGFTFSIDGTYSTNFKNNLSALSLGLGYRLPVGKMFLMPMVKAGYGNANFKLGDIENNDVFIRVNETDFYSDEVAVRLRDQYAYVAPELNAFIPINDRLGIQLSGSYKFAFNRGEKITFRGYLDAQNQEVETELEDISESNIFLNVDGKRITDRANLIDFGGFKGQISFVYYVGK